MSFSSQVSMIFASKDIYSSPNGRHHRKFMSQQTLLIGHHCLIKMMASAKSSICSKITSVRMREKKSESKKSLPRAEVFCNHRCARVKYSGKGERGTHYIKASMIF